MDAKGEEEWAQPGFHKLHTYRAHIHVTIQPGSAERRAIKYQKDTLLLKRKCRLVAHLVLADVTGSVVILAID